MRVRSIQSVVNIPVKYSRSRSSFSTPCLALISFRAPCFAFHLFGYWNLHESHSEFESHVGQIMDEMQDRVFKPTTPGPPSLCVFLCSSLTPFLPPLSVRRAERVLESSIYIDDDVLHDISDDALPIMYIIALASSSDRGPSAYAL